MNPFSLSAHKSQMAGSEQGQVKSSPSSHPRTKLARMKTCLSANEESPLASSVWGGGNCSSSDLSGSLTTLGHASLNHSANCRALSIFSRNLIGLTRRRANKHQLMISTIGKVDVHRTWMVSFAYELGQANATSVNRDLFGVVRGRKVV